MTRIEYVEYVELAIILYLLHFYFLLLRDDFYFWAIYGSSNMCNRDIIIHNFRRIKILHFTDLFLQI